MNRSTPGLPVHHQLLEFTQTHIHRVSDAIQPTHPLSSPSPPAPNPSQHQSFPMSQLFAWGGQSAGVSALASFLPKNTQGWSPLEQTGCSLELFYVKWVSQYKNILRVYAIPNLSAEQSGLSMLREKHEVSLVVSLWHKWWSFIWQLYVFAYIYIFLRIFTHKHG